MTEDRRISLQSELAESRARQDRTDAVTIGSRTRLAARDIMSPDVAFISPGESVVSAAETMTDRSMSCLVVSENGNLQGIVTETDILRKAAADGGDGCGVNVEHIMSSPVRSISPDLSVIETGEIMEAEKIGRLVVVDEGRPIGTITQTGITRVLVSYALSTEVSEIMTTDVGAIVASAAVSEAAELMACRDISCIVVMEKESVAGIFTKRDLLRRVVAGRRDPARTCIRDVMSFPVVTMPSYYSISSAGKLLEEKGFRRLVVVDHNVLRGVVTQTDILKAIKSRLEQDEENHLRLLGQLTAYSHSIWLTEQLSSIVRT